MPDSQGGPAPTTQPRPFHPSLDEFQQYAERESKSGAVSAWFLGTTSLLLRDADTAILSDGFVTRPGLRKALFGRIAPDRERVRETMAKLDVTSLDAVFCGHSHYDHALDAPVFAQLTGAVLLGSSSTLNIGRGIGLPESKLLDAGGGGTFEFGKFALTFIQSTHSDPELFRGHVTAPLVPPKRQWKWKTGLTYSVLIRHEERAILLHGSAKYVPGALTDVRADVVYLGIGSLGRKKDDFVDEYWREVVLGTGARRVILVHWDDFFTSLDEPLRPMRRPIDQVPQGIRHILRRAKDDDVEVLLPVAWQQTDPFAGLF